METTGVDHTDRLFVASQLVQQGDILQIEVVTGEDCLFDFIQQGQAVGMRTVQALVQLVEFHQDTGIPYIQLKRPFK